MIGTFEGGEVTIGGGATGAVTYSINQVDWSPTLSPATTSTAWYCKLNIDGGQYSGTTVTISWQLQRLTAIDSWTPFGTPVSTSMSLSDGANDVYATPTGVETDNPDWSLGITEQGTYRVVATVSTT